MRTLLLSIILFLSLFNEVYTQEKCVVAFVYHRFGDDRFPSTNVTLDQFEYHLQFLKKENYQIITLSEAADYLQNQTSFQKTAVLTIDDGYKSFYKNGLPLLEKYGFKASVSINTETVGGRDYMNWAELKDAQNRGIEIGNHTHSHQYFLNLEESIRYEIFKSELTQSQEIIEEKLGYKPTAFAYPYGEYDPKMKEIVREMGFKIAAAQNSGLIHSGSDLMKCPRFPMSEYYADPSKFNSKARMLPLVIEKEVPSSSVMAENIDQPVLTIEFSKGSLLLDQIQCFIQGGECIKEMKIDGEKIHLTIKSKLPLQNRRRTLCTITVPDENGKWHWFSHLWIDPETN